MYNEQAFVPSQRPEMLRLEHSRGRVSIASRCAITVILLAICALTLSLTTRFTVPSAKAGKGTAVSSQSLGTKALQPTAPASGFTLFQPPRSSSFVVSAVVPSTNLTSETWLYNRPPPHFLLISLK